MRLGVTVVVVGANARIGFKAVKHLASMGPGELVLACRDARRGQAALAAIKKDAGFANVEVRITDLTQFNSVVDFMAKFEQEEVRLDIMLYNVGVVTWDYATTTDGWETTPMQAAGQWSVLLSLLLLPLMLKTAAAFLMHPRTVIVTSETHFWADVSDEELASPKILRKVNDAAYTQLNVYSM